ncbi:dockerin [Myxococcota bacterium]
MGETDDAAARIEPVWDWNGIVGTGQSLAVGTVPVTSETQPYNNLKLSLGRATVPPWDPNHPDLAMAPLVEPIRPITGGYPRPYPENLCGESLHSAMANQITFLVRAVSGRDFVSVHTVVGESGQGMESLKKRPGRTTGSTGRAYAATLFEVAAIARLAQAHGKTFGIGAIVMTHGETDSGSPSYESELIQLLEDYNADLAAITGQTTRIPMFMSQQFAYPKGPGQRPVATLTQWQLAVERARDFVCTGPKYQYPGQGDGVHLSAEGYRQLGEKTGQVYFERVVLGRDWRPLQPLSAERAGRTIRVRFHVPVPPLVWDETLLMPNAWPGGRGFEVRAGTHAVDIHHVEVVRDSVEITCAAPLSETGLTVAYALTSGKRQMTSGARAYRWGQLRDSDPFVGSNTRSVQPNYCVTFQMPVR